MKQRVAIFDFCETLVPFQTGDGFLRLLVFKHKQSIHKIAAYVITTRLWRKTLKLFAPNQSTRDWLVPLTRGISEASVVETGYEYAAQLRPFLNEDMKKILNQHLSDGSSIFIASGGYEEYLQFFFDKSTQVKIVGSRLQYLNGSATGKLDGFVCLGKEKVERLRKILDQAIDQVESSVYSDCKSDAPLFGMVCKNRWLVTLPRSANKTAILERFGVNE
jgi:HAD superfamily hydrolase (TIGR01490 family)